eukprot:6203936-Pyramimonas_sp.AAC.1
MRVSALRTAPRRCPRRPWRPPEALSDSRPKSPRQFQECSRLPLYVSHHVLLPPLPINAPTESPPKRPTRERVARGVQSRAG